MKKLKDFADDIEKCSKCGLCQSVCPIYEETGNDCAVSRGKFIMLSGILKGDLKFTRKVDKYLDQCTKCGACSRFCPSGINAEEIFLAAKAEYFEQSFGGKILKLVHSLPLRRCFVIFRRRFACKTRSAMVSKPQSSARNVLFFQGCVNDIYPSSAKATISVLKKIGIEVSSPDFNCCGLPFLSAGNVEQFEKQKKVNLSKLPDDFDFILTDCASCESTLKLYGDEVSAKLKNVYEFIADADVKFKFKEKTTFTFHKPCHLKNMDFLPKILEKCENLEYIEMKDYDKCCGFAGEFALRNHKLSKKITRKKALAAKATGAQYITTVCPSCIMGLYQGGVKPINLIDLLAKGISN